METSTHGGSSENAADIVHFEDPKLEELILNTEQFGYKIDANEDGVLTKEEMSHLHGLDASGMGITSLEGIQYAGHEAGNSIFDFSDNAITDLTPIAELYAAHPDAFFQTIDPAQQPDQRFFRAVRHVDESAERAGHRRKPSRRPITISPSGARRMRSLHPGR